MFANVKLGSTWGSLALWLDTYLWNPITLNQIIVIAACFIIGAIFYRIVRKRVSAAIDNSTLPARAKRILNNLRRLIFPLATLIIMFLSLHIASMDEVHMGTSLISGTLKILLAWIVIRVAVEIIADAITRTFFAFTIWVIAALSILGILDETTAALDAIGFNLGDLRLSALAVIKGLLAIFLLMYLAGLLSTLAERRVLRSKDLTRSSQVLIGKIIRITLITCAILIAVTSAGIDLSIFAVFSGAVGLGVGFGLQRVVSNLFSGILLLMDKSIEPGDVIELEKSGTFGWVNHMAARYTEIVTRDNKSYLIPNEEFITQNVVNWSHGNRLNRLEVKLRAHYKSDPHKVIAIAKEAATRPERVVSNPEPVCWLVEFGESSIEFSLRFWIRDAEAGVTNIKGEVLLAVWDAFKEHGIQIPYPHREVFMHNADD